MNGEFEIKERTFEPNSCTYARLKEGKFTHSSGNVAEEKGVFYPDGPFSILQDGEVTYRDGTKEKGIFDPKAFHPNARLKLQDGEIKYPDGTKATVKDGKII